MSDCKEEWVVAPLVLAELAGRRPMEEVSGIWNYSLTVSTVLGIERY